MVDLAASSVASRRKAINKDEAAGEVPAKILPGSEGTLDEEQEDEEHSNENIVMTSPKPNANATVKITRRSPVHASDPRVTTIRNAGELNRRIVEPERNCILFLTVSYCQKCKRMTPHFNRMARKMSSAPSEGTSTTRPSDDGALFARLDVSNGPRGKQLGEILGSEKVPSVIVFRRGNRMKVGGGGGRNDEDELSSTVVERGNLHRLEEVAKVLERGEGSDASMMALMSLEAAEI